MAAGADIKKRRPDRTGRARNLRRDETKEEYLLWGELRGRRLNGYKFIRQIPLRPYIVDFLCRERKLVVEIDGFHHADDPKNIVRNAWLNERGYSVVRFWNHDVTRQRRSVLETIIAALERRIEAQQNASLRYYPAVKNGALDGDA